MRHRIAHRKLGRVTEHRIALLRNQADALLRHERIRTTVAKAKELRPFVERLITVAKRSLADGPDSGRTVHARRRVRRDLADSEVTAKLFETIAPRFASRPGGYIRILRLGQRQGDAAEMAQVELIGSEYDPDVLLPLAVQLERHADNAVPAMFGGLRVIVETDEGKGVTQIGVDLPEELQLVLLIPAFSMPTEETRRRLPERLTRNQAVHNIGRAALLLAALQARR